MCDLTADQLLASTEGWDCLPLARPEGTAESGLTGGVFSIGVTMGMGETLELRGMTHSCSSSFATMYPQLHLGLGTRAIFLVAEARWTCHACHSSWAGHAPVCEPCSHHPLCAGLQGHKPRCFQQPPFHLAMSTSVSNGEAPLSYFQ